MKKDILRFQENEAKKQAREMKKDFLRFQENEAKKLMKSRWKKNQSNTKVARSSKKSST